MLGTPRPDSAEPDWFHDPVTGRRAPDRQLAFQIHYRDEAETGNIKQIWEMFRHRQITVLATAWWLTQQERYAEVAAGQLRSWWSENPFLTGVHWTSGIEAGIRLISWTWARRLLDDWPKVTTSSSTMTTPSGRLRGTRSSLPHSPAAAHPPTTISWPRRRAGSSPLVHFPGTPERPSGGEARCAPRA